MEIPTASSCHRQSSFVHHLESLRYMNWDANCWVYFLICFDCSDHQLFPWKTSFFLEKILVPFSMICVQSHLIHSQCRHKCCLSFLYFQLRHWTSTHCIDWLILFSMPPFATFYHELAMRASPNWSLRWNCPRLALWKTVCIWACLIFVDAEARS